MDLRFTDEENAFRNEVRNFFRTEIPAEIRRKYSEGEEISREEMVTSHRILNAKGWATPRWPVEWGGQRWTPIQHHIFLEEMQFNSVPQPLQFNVDMLGPIIAAFGSEEQKRQFLPRAANLDDWWAQGFSEPGAGRARLRPITAPEAAAARMTKPNSPPCDRTIASRRAERMPRSCQRPMQ